jgi:hypothetical protein
MDGAEMQDFPRVALLALVLVAVVTAGAVILKSSSDRFGVASGPPPATTGQGTMPSSR